MITIVRHLILNPVTMVFLPPPSAPSLGEIPDAVPLCDFMFDEKHGRRPIAESLDSYICGITAKRVSARQQKDRVAWLATSLAQNLGWSVNEGSEFDKVVAIFALNTVSCPILVSWESILHRQDGLEADHLSTDRHHDCFLGCSPSQWSVFASECCILCG